MEEEVEKLRAFKKRTNLKFAAYEERQRKDRIKMNEKISKTNDKWRKYKEDQKRKLQKVRELRRALRKRLSLLILPLHAIP